VDRGKVLELLLVHDNAESRIGDVDKIMLRYMPDKYEAEEVALKEQVADLPEEIGSRIIDLT